MMLKPGVNRVFGLSPYLVVTWTLHLFQSLSSANPDLSCLSTTGEGISSRWSTLSWDVPSDLLSSQTPDFPGTTPLDCDSRPSSGADTINSSFKKNFLLFCKEHFKIFFCVLTWTFNRGASLSCLYSLKENCVISHCSTVLFPLFSICFFGSLYNYLVTAAIWCCMIFSSAVLIKTWMKRC